MKKINLVYDGSMLLNQLQTGNRISRTGIFFVVYNVLKQFLDNPNLNVSVYTKNDKDVLQNAFYELYPNHKLVIKDFNIKPQLSSSYFIDMLSNDGLENWNNPEKIARWTKEKSFISFDINTKIYKNITIKLWVNTVLPSVKQIIIKDEKNGEILKSLTPMEAKQGIEINILKDKIKDNNVCVSIESVNASTPKDLGMNSDTRLLGIRISNVLIQIDNERISWTNGYLRYLQDKCSKFDKKQNRGKYLKLKAFIQFVKQFIYIKKFFKKGYQDIKNVDVFFSPCFAIPKEIAKNKKIQKYTILYDTLPYVTPKEYYPSHGWKFLFDLYETLNKKDYYFCISENTKKDFLKYIKRLDKNKMKVALLAAADYFYKCDDKKRLQQVFEKYNLPKIDKYIFSLCTLDPRKNLVTPIRSFLKFIKKNNIKDLYFLLGGGHVSEYLTQIEDILKEYPEQRNNIIQLGYIDDEDLAPFLSNAQWDVYTPFYEGFGLPPLEAMQCGCPVITSNNSSLPEVVGDAGILIDCTSDDEHVAAFEKYYFDEQFRKEMADKGYERSKTFSWKKMSDIMVMEILKNAKN